MSPEEHMKAAYSQLEQSARKCAMKYLDDFIAMKCAPDLLALEIFPNAKEISESMGAFAAVEKSLGHQALNDSATHVVCPGDGHRPRTAAMFAFRSRWTAWSIDPQLKAIRLDALRRPIERLRQFSCPIEQFELPPCSRAIVVAVHSHARLGAAVQACRNAESLHVVAIGCCVPQELDRPPDRVYVDRRIMSPRNEIRVWLPESVRSVRDGRTGMEQSGSSSGS